MRCEAYTLTRASQLNLFLAKPNGKGRDQRDASEDFMRRIADHPCQESDHFAVYTFGNASGLLPR